MLGQAQIAKLSKKGNNSGSDSGSEDEQKQATAPLSSRIASQATELTPDLIQQLLSMGKAERIMTMKTLPGKLAKKFYSDHATPDMLREEWAGELWSFFGPIEDSDEEEDYSDESSSEEEEEEAQKKTRKGEKSSSESEQETEKLRKLTLTPKEEKKEEQAQTLKVILHYEIEKRKIEKQPNVVSAELDGYQPDSEETNVWVVKYKGADAIKDLQKLEPRAILGRAAGYNWQGQEYEGGDEHAKGQHAADGSEMSVKTGIACKTKDYDTDSARRSNGFAISNSSNDQESIKKTHFIQIFWSEVISNCNDGSKHYYKKPIMHPKLTILPAQDGKPQASNYVLDANGFYDERAHQFRAPGSVLMFDAPSDLAPQQLEEAYTSNKDVASVDYKLHFSTYLVRDNAPLFRVDLEVARHYPYDPNRTRYNAEPHYAVQTGQVGEVDPAHKAAWDLCMQNETKK